MNSHKFWGFLFGLITILQFLSMVVRHWPSNEVLFLFALAILANIEHGIADVLEKLEDK